MIWEEEEEENIGGLFVHVPDRPCCIDERCSRDESADGRLPVVVAGFVAVVGDAVVAVDDAGVDGDAAAGADEPTKPPIQNSI